MNTILQKLYDGELCPAEQVSSKVEKYQNIKRKHYYNYENFAKKLKKLKPPLHKKFMAIIDEQLDIVALEELDVFIDGFKLGAKMMMEILDNN